MGYRKHGCKGSHPGYGKLFSFNQETQRPKSWHLQSAGSGPAGVPRSVRATQLPLGSPCPWEQCSCPLCGTQPRLWCLPVNATCRSHNGSTTSSMCTAVTFLTPPSVRMLLSSYNNKISLPLEVNPNFHWSVTTITHHKKHLIFNLYNRSIPTNTSASLHAVQVAT